jgi:hypothetical protein
MIINGTIQYQVVAGGGFDEKGNPIPVSTDWSVPVECGIKENSYSNKGSYIDGKFTIASFEVLVGEAPESFKRVKLTRAGRNLGEFPVQSVRPLINVGRVKIVV